MTANFCTIAAAVFALLTATTPAYAATIDEAVSLQFAGGNQLAGTLDFFGQSKGPPPIGFYYTEFNVTAESDLTFNGTPTTIFDYASFTNPALTLLVPSGGFLNIDTSDISNLDFADFILNGTAATSGTVSCVSGCDINAVPLPDALPMLGAAIIGLWGLAARRSRQTVRG